MKLSRTVKRISAGWMPGGRCYCPICGHRVWRFLPYRRRPAALMQALDTVGSDTKNFECPRCGAHDRERHLLLYMRAIGLLDGIRDKDVLHFAPELRLSRHFVNTRPSRYVQCDLYPKSPNVQRVDLLDIQFDAEAFDAVIANHVLEHVANDEKALSEIFRVLRPGGWAILQTPFSSKLHRTWDDPGIDNDKSRLQAYGQEDHVRLYGRDVFERIASSGLLPDIRSHVEVLPDCDPEVVGVNQDEPLFLFWRRN